MAESNEHSVIEIPTAAFWGLLSAALLGGAGGYSAFGPHLEKEALKECFDNSRIAIDVAAQHGEEINTLRGVIAENYRLIYEKTQSRYTAEDADKAWREQERIDNVQNRRLEYIERQLDK